MTFAAPPGPPPARPSWAPTPPSAPRARTSAAWHLAPLALWLLSLVVLALAVLVLYRSLVPDPQPIDPGDRVRLTDAGMTLYQDVTGDGASCDLRSDGRRVVLSGGGRVVSTEGLELRTVGHTPRQVTPGVYTLVCSDDPDQLYAGRRTNLVEGILIGAGSLVLFLGAVAFWVVILVRRRRARA